MCWVSAIHDLGQTVPYHQWTPDAFHDFKEVIRRLEELDRKLGQPDCVDPSKARWIREVEKRLDELESQ